MAFVSSASASGFATSVEANHPRTLPGICLLQYMDLLHGILPRQNHGIGDSAPIQVNDIIFGGPSQMVMAVDDWPSPEIRLSASRKRAGNGPSQRKRKLSAVNG